MKALPPKVKAAYKEMISTEAGQIVMAHLATECGWLSNSGLENEAVLRSFYISLLGATGLLKDDGNFPLRLIKSMNSIPEGK